MLRKTLLDWGSVGRAGRLVIRGFESRLLLVACRSVQQDTEPQIAPDEQLAPCMAASTISVWMCVWMDECGMFCKVLWAVSRLEKRYKNADHLYIYHFFTIYCPSPLSLWLFPGW